MFCGFSFTLLVFFFFLLCTVGCVVDSQNLRCTNRCLAQGLCKAVISNMRYKLMIWSATNVTCRSCALADYRATACFLPRCQRLNAGQLESGPSSSHQLGQLYKTFKRCSCMTEQWKTQQWPLTHALPTSLACRLYVFETMGQMYKHVYRHMLKLTYQSVILAQFR